MNIPIEIVEYILLINYTTAFKYIKRFPNTKIFNKKNKNYLFFKKIYNNLHYHYNNNTDPVFALIIPDIINYDNTYDRYIITNKKYKFDYQDINDNIPLFKMYYSNNNKIQIKRFADILRGFIVKGKNIKSISLTNCGNTIYQQWKFIKPVNITNLIRPFYKYLPLISLQFHCVYLQIMADEIDYVMLSYGQLNAEDRSYLQNPFKFEGPFFDFTNKTRYKEVSFQNGIFTMN